MDEFPLSLEEVQAELDAEQREWQKLGIGLNHINYGELGPVLFDLSVRMQTLTNVLVMNGAINEDELNLQYKWILLKNLQEMRQAAPQQQSDALRRQILEGIHMPRPNGKPPWEA